MGLLARSGTPTTSTPTSTSRYTLHSGIPPAAPLTTIFTPPASCTSYYNQYTKAQCMPDRWANYISDAGYYSPGICPSGYYGACTAMKDDISYYDGTLFPPLEPAETAVYCCPTGFGCERASMCQSYTKSAYAIQVRWQSSDLSSLQTPPTVPTTASFNTYTYDYYSSYYYGTDDPYYTDYYTTSDRYRTQTGSSARSTSDLDSGDTDSSGLTTAEKIGIGVGVPIGALAIFAAILTFLLLCWRSSRKEARDQARRAKEADLAVMEFTRSCASVPQMTTAAAYIRDTPTEERPALPPRPSSTGHTAPASMMRMSGGSNLNRAVPPISEESSDDLYEVPRSSGPPLPPAVYLPPGAEDDDEVKQIKQEQVKLMERKSRLLELQQLEDEERRLQQRLADRLAAIQKPLTPSAPIIAVEPPACPAPDVPKDTPNLSAPDVVEDTAKASSPDAVDDAPRVSAPDAKPSSSSSS